MIYYKGSINNYRELEEYKYADLLRLDADGEKIRFQYTSNYENYTTEKKVLVTLIQTFLQKKYGCSSYCELKNDISGTNLPVPDDTMEQLPTFNIYKDAWHLPSLVDDIIYTKFKDKDGHEYGREIQTGLVFPIFDSSNINTSYSIHPSMYSSCIYMQLFALPNVSNPLIADLRYVIAEKNELANLIDLEEYRLIKDDVKELTKACKSNIFLDNIVEEENKVRLLDEEMKLLGEISYYLNRIKNNEELENLYNQLNCLLKSYDKVDMISPVGINDIKNLKSKVMFLYYFDRTNENGIVSSIKEIIDNINHYSIKDIDELYELFIDNNNLCTLEEKYNILSYLSYAYVKMIKVFNLELAELNIEYFDSLKMYMLSFFSDSSILDSNNDNSVIEFIKNNRIIGKRLNLKN